MPSKLNASLLCLMLAALLQRAPGAPVDGAPTDSPAGEPSGEEGERASDLLSESPAWGPDASGLHKQEFEREFQGQVKYDFLSHYNITSFPAGCSKSNLNMEACVHRLVEGMYFYKALLERVAKEYPDSLLTSQARHYSSLLITCLQQKLSNRKQITVITSSQEQQLRDLDQLDTFHRKMAAHSILYTLQRFLVDGKRAIRQREMLRGRKARLWNPSPSIAFKGLLHRLEYEGVLNSEIL